MSRFTNRWSQHDQGGEQGRGYRAARWTRFILGAVLLCSMAVVWPVAAADGPDVEDDQLQLSLQEAVDMALENNVALLMDGISVDKARVGLEQVRALSLLE